MKPDVLVIGDSHAAPLAWGCEALGLKVEHISFSGRNWHEGNIIPHDDHGIWVKKRRWAQKIFTDLMEQLGVSNLANTGMPVLGSFGYHMGRLVPPFGWNDHVSPAEDEPFPENHLHASSAFVSDYVHLYRNPHFRLARNFARGSRLALIAPPPAFSRPNYKAFRLEITRRLMAEGAAVYDPEEDFIDPETGVMRPELLAGDNIHGNEEYGRQLVSKLIERGYFERP
ncbi:MAG: hypothetical protein ACWA47_10655 [Brevirhabdus sp.]